jgi:hypothetical protein
VFPKTKAQFIVLKFASREEVVGVRKPLRAFLLSRKFRSTAYALPHILTRDESEAAQGSAKEHSDPTSTSLLP